MILSSTGSLTQPYTYTGREYDSETGLYYYRDRYYDPKIGRFLQEDPILSKNLYSYVRNNPLNLVDPFGLRERWQYVLPDFLSTNVSITVPTSYTGKKLSWSISASADRYGNWYWSILGPGVGRTPRDVSVSVTANWLVQKDIPTENQLCNFLTGHSITVAGGNWVGGNGIYSPGNGVALGIGVVSPQLGRNYSYSYKGSGNTGITW